ncbi:MAG: hydroxymethylbilane synthase [Planctomycetota bacterium]|jgi:hydroxymethylbilane synthase
MRRINIASRASKLALIQADYIRSLIQNLSDDIEIAIAEVSTKGDRDKSDFLYKSESVGFFTSEVENALLNTKADIAVHSLKDLPTAITPPLTVAAIPKRQSPADALVASEQIASITDLPPGATVGTSSLRRIAQLKHLRQDLKCVPLRGNVETRVNKVLSGQIDAAVVACAGLNRLSLADRISAVLPPQDFIPAPGQGALAVQVRADDSWLVELLRQFDDHPTRIAVEAERAVLAALHGGCSIPLGVYAHISDDIITIDAMLSDVEAKRYIRHSESDHIDRSIDCAQKLARKLLSTGGREILNKLRNT